MSNSKCGRPRPAQDSLHEGVGAANLQQHGESVDAADEEGDERDENVVEEDDDTDSAGSGDDFNETSSDGHGAGRLGSICVGLAVGLVDGAFYTSDRWWACDDR